MTPTSPLSPSTTAPRGWIRVLALLAALALAASLAACSDDDDSDSSDASNDSSDDSDGGGASDAAFASDFDGDAQGWTTNADGGDPTLETEGGNPGGYLRAEDSPSGDTWYWVAPSEWAGDRSDVVDGALRFDQLQDATENQFDDFDVILLGGSDPDELTAISYSHGLQPETDWTTFVIPLGDDGWYDEALQPVAPGTVADVLGELYGIQIRGEFQDGPDASGLDNVILTAETPDPDEITPAVDPVADLGFEAPEGTDGGGDAGDDDDGDDPTKEDGDATGGEDTGRPEPDVTVDLVAEQVVAGGPVGTFDYFGTVGVTAGNDRISFLVDVGLPTDDEIIEVTLYRGDPGIDGAPVAQFSGPLTVEQNNVHTYYLDEVGLGEALTEDVSANASSFYVEVVTAEWPSGALRGQLG